MATGPGGPSRAERRAESKASSTEEPVTILIADDEPAILRLAGDVLRVQGYEILQASDGLEALEVASGHTGAIHLLLTDICMPRLGGSELHQRLKSTRPETRTLFMSGSGSSSLENHSPFLPKPFTTRLLVSKVREVLDQRARREPGVAGEGVGLPGGITGGIKSSPFAA